MNINMSILVGHIEFEHFSSLRADIANLEEESAWILLLLSKMSKSSCGDEQIV